MSAAEYFSQLLVHAHRVDHKRENPVVEPQKGNGKPGRLII